MRSIDAIESETLVKAILDKDNVSASEQLEKILQRKCAERIDAIVNK